MPLLALFIRNLREDLRSRAMLWSRLGLTLLVVFSLIQGGSSGFGGAPGLAVFSSLAWMNLFFIVAAALGYFASAITEEKEEGTLGLLCMANLSPFAILLGKGASRFVGGVLLLLVQVPFAFLAVTLGGIRAEQIIGAYLLLLAFMLFACGAGLLGSVLARRSGIAAVWCAVFLYAVCMLPSHLSDLSEREIIWIRVQNVTDVINTLRQILSPGGMIAGILPCAAGLGLMGVVFMFLARLGFDRFCLSEETVSRPRSIPGSSSTRRRPSGDPVAWKDYHQMHGGQAVMVIKFFLYSVLAAVIIAPLMETNNNLGFGRMMIAMSLVFWFLLIMLAELSFAASRIYKLEKRNRTLGSLALIPHSLEQLMASKRRAVYRSLFPALFFLVPSLIALPFQILDQKGLSTDYVIYAIMSVALFVSYCWLGLRMIEWFSLRLKWGGLPLALAVIWVTFSLGSGVTFILFREASLVILPITAIIVGILLHKAHKARLREAIESE